MKKVLIIFLSVVFLWSGGISLIQAMGNNSEDETDPGSILEKKDKLLGDYEKMKSELDSRNKDSTAGKLNEQIDDAALCKTPNTSDLRNKLNDFLEQLNKMMEEVRKLDQLLKDKKGDLSKKITEKIGELSKELQKEMQGRAGLQSEVKKMEKISSKKKSAPPQPPGKIDTKDPDLIEKQKKEILAGAIASRDKEKETEWENIKQKCKSSPVFKSLAEKEKIVKDIETRLAEVKANLDKAERDKKNAKSEEEKRHHDREVGKFITGKMKQESTLKAAKKSRDEAITQCSKDIASNLDDLDEAIQGSWKRIKEIQLEISGYKILMIKLSIKQFRNLIKSLKRMISRLTKGIEKLKDLIEKLMACSSTLDELVKEKNAQKTDKEKEKVKKKIRKLKSDLPRGGLPPSPPGIPGQWGIAVTGFNRWVNMPVLNDYIKWINTNYNGNIGEFNTALGGSIIIFYQINPTFSIGASYEYLRTKSDGTLTAADSPITLAHSQCVTAHGFFGVARIDVPLSISRFILRASGSIGFNFASYREAENGHVVKGSGTGLGYKAGLGFYYTLAHGFELGVAASWNGGSINRFEDKAGKTLAFISAFRPDENISADLSGLSVSTGLVFRFGIK